MKRVDEADEGRKLGVCERSGTNTVVYIPTVKLWGGASVLGKDLGLNISNKQVGVVGAHLRAHGDPRDLSVKLLLKRETVEGKNKLS